MKPDGKPEPERKKSLWDLEMNEHYPTKTCLLCARVRAAEAEGETKRAREGSNLYLTTVKYAVLEIAL